MYTPLAAEILRRASERAARQEPSRQPPRRPAPARRWLAELLRRSADRLAPEC